jgi:hypothetical protein
MGLLVVMRGMPEEVIQAPTVLPEAVEIIT